RSGSRYACRLAVERREAERIEAPVLIAAHGSWEPQPWNERAAKRTRSSDLVAFKANFSGTNLEPGLLPVLAFRGGYGGMVVADGGMLTLACCIRRDALREWRAAAHTLSAGDAVQAGLIASCRGVRLALAGARREGAWLSVGPVRPGIHAPWSERSGFAVGNAAGEAHPIVGEGISMAMQSSWLLCRRLARERDALLGGASQAAVARGAAPADRRGSARRQGDAARRARGAARPRACRRAYYGRGDGATARRQRRMTTTFETMKRIIVKDYELPPERLTPDTPLAEVELDSLAITELIFAL